MLGTTAWKKRRVFIRCTGAPRYLTGGPIATAIRDYSKLTAETPMTPKISRHAPPTRYFSGSDTVSPHSCPIHGEHRFSGPQKPRSVPNVAFQNDVSSADYLYRFMFSLDTSTWEEIRHCRRNFMWTVRRLAQFQSFKQVATRLPLRSYMRPELGPTVRLRFHRWEWFRRENRCKSSMWRSFSGDRRWAPLTEGTIDLNSRDYVQELNIWSLLGNKINKDASHEHDF